MKIKSRSVILRGIDYGMRLGFMLVLAVVGFTTARSIRFLLVGQEQQASVKDVAPTESEERLGLTQDLPSPQTGTWLFDDARYVIRKRDIGTSELKSFFPENELNEAEVLSTGADVERLNPHAIDLPGFKFRFPKQGTGKDNKSKPAMIAWETAAGSWSLYELAEADAGHRSYADHLLPIPDESRTIGQWRSETDVVRLEIVEVATDVSELMMFWEESGCQFSADTWHRDAPLHTFVRWHGHDVEVWCRDTSTERPIVLMKNASHN